MPLHWNAQLLRMTLFIRGPLDGSGLWRSITNEEPEVDENRPRDGVRQQMGPFGQGCLLQVSVMNDRLDVFLMPTPADAATADHPPVVGEAHAAVTQLDGALRPWLDSFDVPVLREAFGLVALSPAPDRESSYARLAELVPSVRYDAEAAREVVYQVNRPVRSQALPEVILNRITKWSSMIMQPENFVFRSIGNVEAIPGPAHQFVRCECDNSTPAERGEALPAGSLGAIYEELGRLALENLDRGEIA